MRGPSPIASTRSHRTGASHLGLSGPEVSYGQTDPVASELWLARMHPHLPHTPAGKLPNMDGREKGCLTFKQYFCVCCPVDMAAGRVTEMQPLITDML